MKNTLAIFLATLTGLAGLFALASCSNYTNIREQIRPTYHDVIVETDENAAYAAAFEALTQMGFRITSSGAARKKIEALSAIDPGGFGRPALQTSASVRVGVAPNNTSAIQILFTEIHEGQRTRRESMTTKQPLSESGLYNIFASRVNEALVKQRSPQGGTGK